MTARIISPPLNQLASLRTPLTVGEQRVLDFFDNFLAPEWEIYIQPHLNGLRPDFVLLNPQVGIAVFEVKDWNLDALDYQFELQGKLPPKLVSHSHDGKQFKRRDNPIDKIYTYQQAILNIYCPRLQIRAKEESNFIAVVTVGVVMSGTTTARAEQLFYPSRYFHGMLRHLAYHPLVGGDALDQGEIGKVFPESTRRQS